MISDSTGHLAASIHLDYGADSADFFFEDLFICPRGLQMKTRWSFDAGTELSVNFQIADPGGENGDCRLLKTQGIVVGCEPASTGGGYLITLLFLEVTDDILAVIRDLSAVEEEKAQG
jgi:hypothetical protein